MSHFTIKNLNKQYEGKQILKDINVHLETGKFLVLLGPSGCGKSTLLKIIAGIEQCDSGTISLNENVLNLVRPKDRDIAMVFQSYALYPNLTVYGNIDFGLKARKVPKPERKRIIQELLQMLQIERHSNKKPAKLSGGERQRVAIARALAREPKLFLFDEPLSNLDAELRQQMRVEIKRIHQETKITSIYVTHDQIEAMTLGDILVILKGGEIQQVGAPKEIYKEPANLFVAGFIGSPPMNFIPVEAMSSEKGNFLKLNIKDKTYQLPYRKKIPSSYLNTAVLLGIRPTQIFMKDDPTATIRKGLSSAHNIFAEIKFIEFTGEDSFVIIEINGTQAQIKINPDAISSKQGDTIELVLDTSDSLLFEEKSGVRIV